MKIKAQHAGAKGMSHQLFREGLYQKCRFAYTAQTKEAADRSAASLNYVDVRCSQPHEAQASKGLEHIE
jgi:hypothetical protein